MHLSQAATGFKLDQVENTGQARRLDAGMRGFVETPSIKVTTFRL